MPQFCRDGVTDTGARATAPKGRFHGGEQNMPDDPALVLGN